MLCAALKTSIIATHNSGLWSAFIGLNYLNHRYATSYLFENDWSHALAYVCQYHGKWERVSSLVLVLRRGAGRRKVCQSFRATGSLISLRIFRINFLYNFVKLVFIVLHISWWLFIHYLAKISICS